MLSLLLATTLAAKNYRLCSPGGENIVDINADGDVSYTLVHRGDTILGKSPIAMSVGGKMWGKNARCRSVKQKSNDTEVELTVPRRHRTLRDNYNSMTLGYGDYSIEFRAYNDAVAYRFVSNSPKAGAVEDETIAFALAGNPDLYVSMTDTIQNSFETTYKHSKFNTFPTDSLAMLPILAKTGKYNVVLCEAGVYDYPGLFLTGGKGNLKGVLAGYPAEEILVNDDLQFRVESRKNYLIPGAGKRSFPWRVTACIDNDKDLMSNDIVYLLGNDSDTEEDFSWVKPGKALWDWWNDWDIYEVPFKGGVNTDYYIHMIDWAGKHGIEYLMMDAGWSDYKDLLKIPEGLDMDSICSHAADKGIGVVLWTSAANFRRQMKPALDMMEKWGVKGIKIDFFDRNDAQMMTYMEQVARECAARKMLVDFHGCCPPDGLRRKYPNVITREGVYGLENSKWRYDVTPRHDLDIAFIRQFSGPMDFTPGSMNNNHRDRFFATNTGPMSQGTRSHQVAMYVLYDSPMQMVSESTTLYDLNPASRDFIMDIPTVWDETVPLEGEFGRYVAVARRNGDKWYVAAINGSDSPIEITVNLDFVPSSYTKIRYHADGENSDRQAKDFVCPTKDFHPGPLTIKMARGGGFAAIISK